MTGLNTTHHTNATVFNPKNEETSIITQEIIDDVHEESRPLTKRNINNCKDYRPITESYTDNNNRNQ